MAAQPEPGEAARPVARRLVCFLCGFDPQGPAHYHQLFEHEGRKQSAVSGYELKVGPRRKGGAHIAYWDVEAEFDGQQVHTRYEFLRWDDIVRQHWPRGRLALLARTMWGSWQMWRNGVMWRSWKTSWPMFTAIALPGVAVIGFSALAALLLGGAAALLLRGAWEAALLIMALGLPGWWLAAAKVESKTNMAWLMRSLACLVRQGRGEMPELEERLDHMAAHLADSVHRGDFDEVLLVGHSSGAMLAMSIMARTCRLQVKRGDAPNSTHLSLLTLGHCTPLLSAQREATPFREELQALVDSKTVSWVDYGAPPDGCCFPLVDPTAAEGITGSAAQRPKLLNPRFAQMFTAQSYRLLKGDKFDCHFQYLKAGEIRAGYDYFAITAGPLNLATRHADLRSQTDFDQFQCFGGPAA